MVKILNSTALHMIRMMLQKNISQKLCMRITSMIIITALSALLMTVNIC